MECELAREQREALELQVKKLQEELERIHTGQDPQFLHSFSDLETLSLSSLYTLQKQLRANLEKVDKVSARDLQGRAMLFLLLQAAAFYSQKSAAYQSKSVLVVAKMSFS